jgi:hypothetical protein
VPAVGFAAGYERLFLALAAQGIAAPEPTDPAAFLVALGGDAERWVFATADRLRAAGLRVGLDVKGRSLKAQMKEADRQGARYAVIVGKDELAAEAAQLKDMETGEQRSVPFAALAHVLSDSGTDQHFHFRNGGSLEELEHQYIRHTLETSDTSYAEVARSLGISKQALWEKSRKYNLNDVLSSDELKPPGVE